MPDTTLSNRRHGKPAPPAATLVASTEVTEMATNLTTATPQLAAKPNFIEFQAPRDPRIATRATTANAGVPRRNDLFSEALLEMSSTRPQRRTQDLVISVAS
jgi:hypothetical protein